MVYNHIGTMSNADAMRFAEAKLERLLAYENLAKEVHENACLFADEIHELKNNSFCVVKNALSRDFILDLGRKLEHHLEETLPGRQVRDYSASNAATTATGVVYKTFSENETLDTARQVLPGLSAMEPFLGLPQAIEILENKTLQGVVTGFYESVPKITHAKARMAFNNSIGPLDTQLWHSDAQSFRNLKVLIYLNDVTTDGGPFEIIRGSHIEKFDGWYNTRPPMAHESTTSTTRHSDEKLYKNYSDDRFTKIAANAGDILFADVTAFHRGNVPVARDRKIIIFNFNVHEEYGLPPVDIRIFQKDYDKVSRLTRPFLDDLKVVAEEDLW
tara:strand:+ start:973 stop:1962 length:990 start_codon:yes stop_codon:yes gene_type:complete